MVFRDQQSPRLAFSIYIAGLMIPCLALLVGTVLQIADDEGWPPELLPAPAQDPRLPVRPLMSLDWGRTGPIRTRLAPPIWVGGSSQEQRDSRFEARAANAKASEYLGQQEYRKAIESATRGWELSRSAKFPLGAAEARKTLSLAHQGLGDFESAIGHWEKLVGLLEHFQDPHSLAVARQNLGVLFNSMGRWQEAADAFSKALETLPQVEDPLALAAAKGGLALAWFQLGKTGWQALLASALEIQREHADLPAVAGTLDRMAILAVEEGRFDEAESRFREALEIRRRHLRDPQGEALVVGNRGWMEVRRGHHSAGLIDLRQALEYFVKERLPTGQAFALLGCARAELKLGQLDAAFADAKAAIAQLETQRARLQTPLWRMVYLDHRINYFDTYLEVAMAKHRRDRRAGFDRVAFDAAEAARGRGLLDLLAARRGATDGNAGRFAPRTYGSLAALREPGTVFLVYYVSEERAFLWSLGPYGPQSFDLGPAAELNSQVEAVYRRLSDSKARRPPTEKELGRLAATLLPPGAVPLKAERLVAVGDGPIRFVPFALLPSPIRGKPLIHDFEISYLPSLSTLAALRSVPTSRKSASHLLAVVADPRLSASSEIVQGQVRLALRSGGVDELKQLEFAKVEAENLLALVPPTGRLGLLGTAANRDAVVSGLLAPYRYLHFATHGLFDANDVRRSGLVLSAYDDRGGKIEAFLSFADIEKIRLDAELVVASACDTAMGKNLRGEGPVGVSQAFLAAGARRTIGSLWQIDDRETSEFMTELYHGLLVEKLSPAAALRRTQLRFLEKTPAGRRPEWAAFVLLGEYL